NVTFAYSAPGWEPVPFGYAGGLYDPEAEIVRFSARDYDPQLGRWTAPDPFGFGGGDGNLYRYAGNSPAVTVDPTGLYEQDVHFLLTRTLALRAGFTPAEADEIARADQGVDENPRTSPFANVEARRQYHFTSDARRAEMRESAVKAQSLE